LIFIWADREFFALLNDIKNILKHSLGVELLAFATNRPRHKPSRSEIFIFLISLMFLPCRRNMMG